MHAESSPKCNLTSIHQKVIVEKCKNLTDNVYAFCSPLSKSMPFVTIEYYAYLQNPKWS